MGQIAIPCSFENVDSFSEGLARIKLNGKYGFINTIGEVVIPYSFEEVDSFSDGLAKIKLNDKYGFINKIGETVIPCSFEDVGWFSKGFALVYNSSEIYGFDILSRRRTMEISSCVGYINKQGVQYWED